jgi:hypothetical protein
MWHIIIYYASSKNTLKQEYSPFSNIMKGKTNGSEICQDADSFHDANSRSFVLKIFLQLSAL